MQEPASCNAETCYGASAFLGWEEDAAGGWAAQETGWFQLTKVWGSTRLVSVLGHSRLPVGRGLLFIKSPLVMVHRDRANASHSNATLSEVSEP